jgi:pSer/pThr/pTyr-binding forkhead associated (FHA) protein
MGTPPIDHSDANSELTSTINVSTLRAVPGTRESAELLSLLTPEEISIISQLPALDAMFISLSGPGKGGRYLLDKPVFTIGRDPASEIFLDDITVSRKHCEISRNVGGQFEVRDLNSLNGTYLNAISTAKSSLRQGDEVQIGKYRLTFFQSNKFEGKGK